MQVTPEMIQAARQAMPHVVMGDSEIAAVIGAALRAMPKATGGFIPAPSPRGDSILAKLSDSSCTFTLPKTPTQGPLPPGTTITFSPIGDVDDMVEALTCLTGKRTRSAADNAEINAPAPLPGATVETNLGGDIIPHLDGVTRIVRTRPRGNAGEREAPAAANPYDPAPPMVIPDGHPLLDTSSFEDPMAMAMQHRVPVTELRAGVTPGTIAVVLGLGGYYVVMDDIAHAETNGFPEPVFVADRPERNLYDFDAVKAWYDALPQAADE